MTQNVQFLFDRESWVKMSGYYGMKQRMTDNQVVTLVTSCIPLTTAAIHTIRDEGAIMIICTPLAFVKLMIARRDAGFINRFIGLEVSLTPHQEKSPKTFREVGLE